MRFVLMLSTIAATTVLITPSKAQNYPWCAIYGGYDDGGTNCGFTTFEQCMATAKDEARRIAANIAKLPELVRPL